VALPFDPQWLQYFLLLTIVYILYSILTTARVSFYVPRNFISTCFFSVYRPLTTLLTLSKYFITADLTLKLLAPTTVGARINP